MASQVDVTKPIYGSPTTESVRLNFQILANEVTALQDIISKGPFLPLTGGHMTGPMYLYNDPTDPRMPATKAYVDAGGTGGGGGITEAPADGTLYGREDGTWLHAVNTAELNAAIGTAMAAVPSEAPSDGKSYGRMNKGWASVLPMLGGTLLGMLTLHADPVNAMDAATKQYIDTKAGAYLPLAGGTLTGNLTLQGAANTNRLIVWSTGANPRWAAYAAGTPESTGNAGSDWWLDRFSDAGSNLGSALQINRATGVTRINGRTLINNVGDDGISALQINGKLTVTNGDLAVGGNHVISTAGAIFGDHLMAFRAGPYGGSILSWPTDTGAATGFRGNSAATQIDFGPIDATNGNMLSSWAAITGSSLYLNSGGGNIFGLSFGSGNFIFNWGVAGWIDWFGSKTRYWRNGDTGIDIAQLGSDGSLYLKGGVYPAGSGLFGLWYDGANYIRGWAQDYYDYLNPSNGYRVWQSWGPNQSMTLSFSGQLQILAGALKPGGGPWTDTSDIRIKDVVGDYEHGLDELLALKPIRYTFKETFGGTGKPLTGVGDVKLRGSHAVAIDEKKEFIGLIAQDVETVMPEMVSQAEGIIEGKQVEDLRSLDTNALQYALINAIKTLDARLRALEGVA